MPIYDRTQLRKGGFAQVRAALQSFEGTVTKCVEDQWGGQLFDEGGNPVPPREFLEITCEDVRVREITEELAMDIEGGEFSFRVNASSSDRSFWSENFLPSIDKFKILLPTGLVGKRVFWKKETRKADDPKFDATNFVLAGIVKDTPKKVATLAVSPTRGSAESEDKTVRDMDLALELAVGKTEAQFRSAVALKPELRGSPVLGLAKAGVLTTAFVKEGKLVEVKRGSQTIYQKPDES